MKKLLILLFSILISFNSYAGSLDDKGLRCEPRGVNDERPMFIWFEDNLYSVPEIVGYEILWFAPYSIDFIGTKEITFRGPKSSGDDLGWWKTKKVNRETLNIRDIYNVNFKGNCKVISSIQVIKDALNAEIDAAKSVNKI
jgi:hypothetical protein